MYSILYIFIVILMGFQEAGEIKMKTKWTKLLPHNCLLIIPQLQWVNRIIRDLFCVSSFWDEEHVLLDSMLGKDLKV